MEILVWMIVYSASLSTFFFIIFIYNLEKGQFGEDESPAIRMLDDSTIE